MRSVLSRSCEDDEREGEIMKKAIGEFFMYSAIMLIAMAFGWAVVVIGLGMLGLL